MAETMPLAERAAEEISQIFPRPILLEFEKVYWPCILMTKKRYVGMKFESVEEFEAAEAAERATAEAARGTSVVWRARDRALVAAALT